MKKILIVAIVLFIGFGWSSHLLSGKYQKPRFYIKLSGNASLSNAGDFGDYIDRHSLYLTNLSNTPSSDPRITLKEDSFFQGFGGEIGIEVSKHAVGISVGTLEKKFITDWSYNGSATSPAQTIHTESKFSAVPVFLLIHYKLVNQRLAKVFLTVGEGFYFGVYRENKETTTGMSNGASTVIGYLESKRNHLGMHVGLSVDLNITRNLALFIDAGYRVVRFKDMTAESMADVSSNETPKEGMLYYSVESAGDDARFDNGTPSLKNWESRPAVFNLNGLSATAGLKFIL